MREIMNPSLLWIIISASALSADGFAPFNNLHLQSESSISKRSRCHRQNRTVHISFRCYEPHAPQSTIDARTLLAQVNRFLTLKDIKSVLRPHTSILGTKSVLRRRLGLLLGVADTDDEGTTNSTDLDTSPQDSLRKKYKRMTVAQLKAQLKGRGAKVSGRKTELVQRLIDLDAADTESSDAITSGNESNEIDTQEIDKWYVLEPTFSQFATDDLADSTDDAELPILSTLLFVNKPCGMSTLPTREVEGYPTFPCLSEEVKEWLATNPDGIQLIHRARADEDHYWKNMLSTIAQTSNKKLLKAKTRQYEKLKMKQSTFQPRPVHRLDIDTSGIVCIALTPYALRAAGMLFEQKSRQSGHADTETNVDKTYVAVVQGEIQYSAKKGTVSHGIGKIWVQDSQSATDGHHEWACDIMNDESVAFCRPGDEIRPDPLQFVDGSVRDAITSYRVLGSSSRNNNTRVELTPHTGRGHQLRLHMSSLGHPIIGKSSSEF